MLVMPVRLCSLIRELVFDMFVERIGPACDIYLLTEVDYSSMITYFSSLVILLLTALTFTIYGS
jgi:hypothetical protein